MEEDNKDQLEFQHLAGGNITKFPPIFSPDASLLFVVTDKSVQVYSTLTGGCTRCLEGANDPLISLEYEVQDSEVLVGCTETGQVIRWKWSTGTIVGQVQLKIRLDVRFDTFTLLNLCVERREKLAFVTSTKRGMPSQCDVVNSVTGRKVECALNLKLGRQKAKVVADRGSFKYLAIAQGPYIFFVNYRNWDWKRFNNANKVPITCLAVNPKECLVATGDETGKIMLWRQFFGHEKVRTVLYHWHHTSVTSLAFTASGSGFYSSGLEAVLVRWNILHPEQRNFVPRMASIIRHITTSEENSAVAVCTADNGIQILGVDFKTQCTVQEFTYAFDDNTGNKLFPIGLKINPRKNTLVLNSRPGHLQFYSAYTRSLLYNVDIVGQNQLSMETGKILYNTQVTHAAFNIDWMATAELFDDQQHMPELRLKFWEYQKEKQGYSLNTNVELPHDGGMKAIEFSNPYHIDNLVCATAGMDNFIKVWSLEDSGSIYKKGKVWYCVVRTSYKNYPIESIGFSQDSSLLAAGYGGTLCVYKAASLKLIGALKPHGAFDGSLHKAQVSVPSHTKNGSQNLPKKDIIQMFTSLLQSKEKSRVNDLKKAMSTKKVQQHGSLDDAQKKLLYKRLRSTNQLNLFQKLIIYQRLGICFQLKEEWHSKMKEYIEKNLVLGITCNKLQKEVFQLNLRSRFKAKYRLNTYTNRTASYNKNANKNLVPLLKLLNLEDTPKPHLTNGVSNHEEEQENDENFMPPVQSTLVIKTVAFCYGDFAHLVIACTESRVLIWDLLTLRLQTVLKLSTDHIAVDPLTNLISVFTKNNELYVFRPSVALPIYYRANMPKVIGAVWLPRKYPTPQAVIVNWQARSRLYFLTDKQEILYLAKKNEFEEPTVVFAGDVDDPSQLYSTYGAFATNRIFDTETGTINHRPLAIGVQGKSAVESLLNMSSYMMPPLSLLCNDFLKSMVMLDSPKRDASSEAAEDEPMEVSDKSDGEGEMDESTKTRAVILAKMTAKAKSTAEEKIDEERLQKIYEEPIDFEF